VKLSPSHIIALKPAIDRLRQFCVYVAPVVGITVAVLEIALDLKSLTGR
jgi:hypothetical protein